MFLRDFKGSYIAIFFLFNQERRLFAMVKVRFTEDNINWDDAPSLKKACKVVAGKITSTQTQAIAFVTGPVIKSSEEEALMRREEESLLEYILMRLVFLDEYVKDEMKTKL